MYPERRLFHQPLARREIEHHSANHYLQQQCGPYGSDTDAFFIY